MALELLDQFDPDPAKNTKPAPYGAGELNLNWDKVSDCFRLTYGCLAQVRNFCRGLKGMAFQDPAAVAITGGLWTGGEINGARLRNVVVEGATQASGDSAKVYGLDKQAFFNMVWPVATEVLMKNPPAWAGTTSQWQLIYQGRFIKTASNANDHGTTGGSSSAGANTDIGGEVGPGTTGSGGAVAQGTTGTGAGGSGTTGANGGHDHTVTVSGGATTTGTGGPTATGSISLDPSRVPTLSITSGGIPPGGTGGSFLIAAGTDRRLVSEAQSETTHAHPISTHSHSVPAHSHSADVGAVGDHTHTFSSGSHTHTVPAISAHQHSVPGIPGHRHAVTIPVDPQHVLYNCWRRIA